MYVEIYDNADICAEVMTDEVGKVVLPCAATR